MSMFLVSRRQVMGLLGMAAVAVPVSSAWAGGGTRRRVPGTLPSSTNPSCPLLAPLVAGRTLGSWTVERIGELHAGAVTAVLRDAAAVRFCLDICRRDQGLMAPSAPAKTDLYEIFLANEGDGSRPTHEDHGQAALALAEIVRANEHAVRLDGMLTLRERLRRFPGEVGRSYSPT